MPRYNGINHLAMATRDLDATVRYWRDLLGMRLVVGLGREGYRIYFFEITRTDMIAFFEWPGVEPLPEKDHGVPVKGPFAFDHISLGVVSHDDLWEVRDKLEAAGFFVSEPVDHGFIHSIYSHDPNGIPVEFSVAAGREDPRDRPVMADRDPLATALEGADPVDGAWPPARKTPDAERAVYPGEGSEVFDTGD
ncbi:MAG: VOC family protein [Desulfatibacillaceae bacterium]